MMRSKLKHNIKCATVERMYEKDMTDEEIDSVFRELQDTIFMLKTEFMQDSFNIG
jgi:hypothetical protein